MGKKKKDTMELRFYEVPQNGVRHQPTHVLLEERLPPHHKMRKYSLVCRVVAEMLKNGPAVMAVTGGQEQRSRRQPSSRPIQGQRGSPLSRREDDAPVIRSSYGSRTHNGRPADRSPRRIDSAAGQAASLAGEASDASPSPK